MSTDSWRRISPGHPERIALAVDFDSTARPEAGFPRLAALLEPPAELWLTVQPPAADTALVTVEDYLRWWRGRPAGRVDAVLGYCVGCVFAPALADAIAVDQGRRPAVLLVDPELVVTDSLHRELTKAVATLTTLSQTERAGSVAESRTICDSGGDVDATTTSLIKLYEVAASTAFGRLGLDEDTTDEIVSMFRSYLSYLAAAWRLAPEEGWHRAVAFTSAESSPGAPSALRERRFPVGTERMLDNPAVAVAVRQFLDSLGEQEG
jgi:hypothetical protein